jgi:hypothetical protein
MGVLTDFFIATSEEMDTVCHGWKKRAPQLDNYRTLMTTNPFTKEPMTIRTRENPDQPDADEDAVLACEFRHLPWIPQKGILWGEVAELACVLMGWDDERANEEVNGRCLIGPMASDESVIEVHPALIARMAELSSDECVRYGAEWAEEHRENNLNVLGQSMEDIAPTGPDSDWITRLSELSALAKLAVADKRGMYMWICP